MENREAIEWLKGCVVAYEVDNKGKPNGNVTCELIQEVIDMAISALKKQESKKPLKMKDCKLRSPYSCPECYTVIPPGCEYCWRCGKKIDWSKEEEDE